MFQLSYIGSTHTVQGASIKNVIVGDYNIRKNAPNISTRDMESSLYTALTRTSGKLIIIKPNTIGITNNQQDFVLQEPKEGYTPYEEVTDVVLGLPSGQQTKTYTGKVTQLEDNQVFVFGSNPLGVNGNPSKGTGGAALVAHNIAGVKQGEKMDNKLSDSGKAWGITTVSAPGAKRSKTPEEIKAGIKKLYDYALQNPDKEFLVAYQGTEGRNLNGYSNQELADMFSAFPIPNNIVFEQEFSTLLSKPKVESNMSQLTNHSGGAYGGDTFWDIIGREFGVTEHRHYRDSGNQSLSKQLRDKKITATVLTKEQMDKARTEVETLLNKKYPDTLQGNLQVRNYYQVANSDGVFAVAQLDVNKNFKSTAVFGGTNTAVQLGIKLNKPVYVWDITTEKWYKFDTTTNQFEATETPTLTKDFAGVGSRDIESYNIQDKETGSWGPRPEYVGKEKEEKAKQAIRDVYQKTQEQGTQSVQPIPKTGQQTLFGYDEQSKICINF